MTIIRIDPTIPMMYRRSGGSLGWIESRGRAMFMIDPGEDSHLLWTIADDSTGQIWTIANPDVRVTGNISLGTVCEWPDRHGGFADGQKP